MEPIDIWRTAKLLIDQHDADAPIHAGMREDAMLDAGDLDGRAVWMAVRKATEQLLSTSKPADAPIQ